MCRYVRIPPVTRDHSSRRFAHGEEYCSTELDFVSEFPIQITARSCDLACDQDQADYFSSLGRTVHALNLQRWEQVLTEELQNPNAEFITIDGLGNLSMCMPPGGGAAECNPQKAWANHLRWPKGREDSMLNFLRQHQSQ